jgi:hypothetical protein
MLHRFSVRATLLFRGAPDIREVVLHRPVVTEDEPGNEPKDRVIYLAVLRDPQVCAAVWPGRKLESPLAENGSFLSSILVTSTRFACSASTM